MSGKAATPTNQKGTSKAIGQINKNTITFVNLGAKIIWKVIAQCGNIMCFIGRGFANRFPNERVSCVQLNYIGVDTKLGELQLNNATQISIDRMMCYICMTLIVGVIFIYLKLPFCTNPTFYIFIQRNHLYPFEKDFLLLMFHYCYVKHM